MENEIGFAQPVGVRLDQGGSSAFEFLAHDAGRVSGKIHVPHPAASQANQRVPVSGEGQLHDYTEDPVIVVLDLAFEALSAFEDESFDCLNYRGTLVADVAWGGMFERWLWQGSGAEDLAEPVKADLFTDVKLNQDKNRAFEGRAFLRGYIVLRYISHGSEGLAILNHAPYILSESAGSGEKDVRHVILINELASGEG